MLKTKKSLFSLISSGLMVLATILWLVVDSVKCVVSSGSKAQSDSVSGWEALFGIENVSGFNIIALLTVLVALGSAVFFFFFTDKKNQNIALGLLGLATLLFIVVSFTTSLFYLKDYKTAVEYAEKYTGMKVRWGLGAGSILAVILSAGATGLATYTVLKVKD